MTNMSDVEDKLAKLRKEYQSQLPSKLEKIAKIWQGIVLHPNQESLILFHRSIHSLHGSANTYGYNELGKTAGILEKIAKTLLDEPKLTAEQSAKVEELLASLNKLAGKGAESQKIVKQAALPEEQNKTVYLLDDDMNWMSKLTSEMNTFGYKIQKFQEIDTFIEKLDQVSPGILIVDINLVNDQLQNRLSMLYNQKVEIKLPIIFVSTSGEFTLRLKAVRLGGDAYFIKPFLTEDLISRIDKIQKSEIEPIRVLIIDDEMDVASYNSAILEQANMNTNIITRANEIDRALHQFNPDVILMDLAMPDCNGLELAAIIRQQSAFQSIPIIYLSAEEDQFTQLKAMKIGADDFITKATQQEYMVMIIKNRAERYQSLLSLIVKDHLTGIYNHSFILKQLEIELKESMQLHNPLSIAIIDLDKIESINEVYGHQAGDHVLKSLALMIQKKLRPNDIIGRYSGLNFLIILPNTTNETAKTMIDELRKQFIMINYSWNDQIFNATFSAGIASFPEFHSSNDLLKAASESMSNSKKAGRNRTEAS